MAGPWGRLVAALGPPREGDPPALRALRRPRPAPRHQTELLLLLLECPRELCGAGGDGSPEGGSPEWGDNVGGVGGALLTLLTLPPAPPPAPPRSLLLLATLTFLLATGDVAGAAVLGALLVEGEVSGGAPAAAAECLRELRRNRTPGAPPGCLGALRNCYGAPPGIQPLALLRVEEGEDPAHPHSEPAPTSAFLLTPAARAQLLHHPNFGGHAGGGPPSFATGDPAPLHATLLRGGSNFGGIPPHRLAILAQHPAFPPPLRLFYLLCLFQGGALQKNSGGPQLVHPHFITPLFPGWGDPPEIFLPRFETAAAFCSQNGGAQNGVQNGAPQNGGTQNGAQNGGAQNGAPNGSQNALPPSPVKKKEGGRSYLGGLVVFLGGAPPFLFCRVVAAYHRWFGEGGDELWGDKLGGAATTLLGGGHPAAPPCLLELGRVLGGPLGGALQGLVFWGSPLPPPGTPQFRGVLKVLANPPLPLYPPPFHHTPTPHTPPPPRGDPQIRRYLRRLMATERGGWGGAQGILSAAAPLLPFWGVPLLAPPLLRAPPFIFLGGTDPDVGDRLRLHAALAAALGPPKLSGVLGRPPPGAPPPPAPPQSEGGGGGEEGGGAAPTLLPALTPPFCLRVLPGPSPPFPAPPGTPQNPEGWGRVVATKGGPVAIRLRLRVELLGGEGKEGDPHPDGGDPPPPAGETLPHHSPPPPPMISAPPPTISTLPPSVSALPPSGEDPPPRISAPPPTISAPPPTISAPPPSVSALPPIISAPPPSISAPPTSAAPPPSVSAPPPTISAPPPSLSAPPPPILALQLWVGGCAPPSPPPAEGRLAGLVGGGAELTLTLRPHLPLPPHLPVTAIFTPGGGGRGKTRRVGEGGRVFLAPLPPLPLPLGLQLRPLALPPPWDTPRRRRAFHAMWGALGGGGEKGGGGHPQSRLFLPTGGGTPPPALAPFVLDVGGGEVGGGKGWVAAAALPPRGVVLVRGGGGGGAGGGWVELRCQRWGGLVALARLLRGEGEA